MRTTLIALVLVGGVALAATVGAEPEDTLAKQVATLTSTVTQHAARIAQLEVRLAKFEAGPSGVTVTPPEITTFRKMLEDVEQVRRNEREAARAKASEDRLRGRLDSFEPDLTDEQKAQLIALSGKHTQRTRDAFAQLREAGGAREAFRAATDSLRDKLKAEVEKIVPGEASAKVLELMNRDSRGFGSRRR